MSLCKELWLVCLSVFLTTARVMVGMVEAFIPSLLNTFHKKMSSRRSAQKDTLIVLFVLSLVNFFSPNQTTLSDARTPVLTTPPYPFLFPSLSLPLSPSLRSMSDAVVLFDCLGKVQ